jgi:hypothetical protein
MRRLVNFTLWLHGKRHDGDNLLSLLLAAQTIDEHRTSLALAFRAGVKIGRKYPETADRILGQEIEWNI